MSGTRSQATASSSSSSSSFSSASSSSSSSSMKATHPPGRVSHLRAALFNPKAPTRTCALTQLPIAVLQLAGSCLEDKDQSIVKLAKTSKSAYQALYPVIKRALVKVLKKLVIHDDTIQARRLLACHPYLQLRIDEGDPTGLAYRGIATTPYQDALADPMAEEMRGVLEVGFPGETKEEKLSHAALQSREFKDPRFNGLCEEKQGWLECTRFAYNTWAHRDRVYEGSGCAAIYFQPLCDAWLRVSLAQGKWPRRLQKIFSVVPMDKKQSFKGLPVDLPEPHFSRNPSDRWYSDRSGCDLRLLAVPAKQDVSEAAFLENLARLSEGYPVLIRQGEGEAATYFLYAPHIPLDRDESEWRCVLIDDPGVHQLIHVGRRTPVAMVGAVDFSKGKLPYSPLLEELYQFGCTRDLYLGSGHSDFFAAYNYGTRGCVRAGRSASGIDCVSPVARAALLNFNAAVTLFTIRTERLKAYCMDLESYLPRETPTLLSSRPYPPQGKRSFAKPP